MGINIKALMKSDSTKLIFAQTKIRATETGV